MKLVSKYKLSSLPIRPKLVFKGNSMEECIDKNISRLLLSLKAIEILGLFKCLRVNPTQDRSLFNKSDRISKQ